MARWLSNPNYCPMCGNPYSVCPCEADHVEKHSTWIRNEGNAPAELLVNGEIVTLLPKQEYAVALVVEPVASPSTRSQQG